MKPADVLLLTAEKETMAAVKAAVQSDSVGGAANVCKSMVELRTRVSAPAKAATRSIVIVDIDDNPQQTLFDLSKLVAGNPGLLLVVVSREFNEKLVLQAMQAGARHFLRKSAISKDLLTVLDRLLLHESQAPTRLGDVVSVFACSGGCGATTAAVNLATELYLETSKPVLLIDLDPHYGSVAHHLNLRGRYGVAHILNREGAIDRHLVESSTVQFAKGLDVLLSPAAADADTHQPMNYDNLLKVIEACREAYTYVVIDAPRLPRQAVADLASVTRVGVLVFRLTVRDVAYARTMVAALTEAGMPRDRILALANQVKTRGPLLKAVETQKALGVKPLICVRTDWKKAIRSINHGQPLVHSARRSGLRRDLRKVVTQVQRWTSNGHPGKGGA